MLRSIAPELRWQADHILSGDGDCLAYFANGSVQVVQTDTYEPDDLGILAEQQTAELIWIPLE